MFEKRIRISIEVSVNIKNKMYVKPVVVTCTVVISQDFISLFEVTAYYSLLFRFIVEKF